MKNLRTGGWRFVLGLGVALGSAAIYSCSARSPGEEAISSQSAALTVNSIPCESWSHAVVANTGSVTFLNSQATVDSYRSSSGAYGGANVGSDAIIEAAAAFTNNGGTLRGKAITSSPAHLAVVPVPAGARNLPLGSTTPGSVNINNASGSITLAPGNYVAANINVNFPGSITISPPGVVRIWVTGTLNLGGNENVNGLPSNLAFMVTSSATVNVNSGGKLFGLIYAPTSTVNLNSQVFGSVVGGSVTLNSGSAVHTDNSAHCDPSSGGAGTPPPVSTHAPRKLPLPPKTLGCYRGTANGWVAVTCDPSSSFKPEAVSQNAVTTPNAGSATIPFQFAQLEQTFTAYQSEVDTLGGMTTGNNSFSIQGNTVPFPGNNTPAGSVTPDTDWVQFALSASSSSTAVFIQTWDVSQFNRVGGVCPGNVCSIACGCTTYGMSTGSIPTRPTGFTQFDFSTVAGSVYNDTNNLPVIGMVAQFSWFDTNNDPNNFRGLYSIVAPDQYGLAGRWTDFSGAVLGAGSGSAANFTNTSVLHRTLAGSCANGTPPLQGIPWPGNCTGSPQLLPATRITSVSPTGETNNLCQVGASTPLAAASSNLVFFQDLWSSTCAPAPTCISNANRIFIRSTDEDTGARPINVGVTPFWESPDIFVVPQGTPVSVNGISTETLITPGNTFDVYVRVNNDFGCSAVNTAQTLVYIADPSALSTQWISITGNQYQSGPGNPGVNVPAGGRALLGPFSFLAPMNVGDGHKCLLAAIQAQNEPGPADTTNPLATFQVGQRNLEFDNCHVPITNATATNGTVTLTISAVGATPSLSGANSLSVTFPDPGATFYNAWLAGSGTAYGLSQAGGLTTVRLGQVSVTLAPIPIAAGQSITATDQVTLGTGESQTTLQVQATLKDGTGTVVVANGVSCVVSAPVNPG